MKIKEHLFLVGILLLATLVRVFQIDTLPISLFGDETDVGYQAWSLITTGKDYTGHFLPTYLQSLSEWRTPLLSYFLAPYVGLFGPSSLSVRLPVALLGVLNVYLLYLLVKKIFPQKKLLALLSAFVLAIIPWHIHLSRIAIDTTLFLSLYLVAINIFLSRRLLLSLPFFILTLYTYPTANVFTPLILVCLYFVYKPKIDLGHNKLLSCLSIVLVIPILFHLISGSASGRFLGISILNDQKLVDTIIIDRTEPWVIGQKIESLFHNKPLTYLRTFSNQYLSAFSTQFLFISGDPNFRHSINRFGELYMVFAPLLLLGIAVLIKDIASNSSKLFLLWLFLAPIPSALTVDGGSHAIRLSLMIIPLVVTIALGVDNLLSWFKEKQSKIILLFFVLISLVCLLTYFHQYSSHYRYLSAKNWQYGYEQAFKLLSPELATKNNIFINNTYEPSLQKFLFFTQYTPAKFQKEFTGDKTVTSLIPNFDGFRLGNNLYFGSIRAGVSLGDFLNSGDLYVASQKNEIPGDQDWSVETPSDISVLGVTRDVFGQPLFTVLKKK